MEFIWCGKCVCVIGKLWLLIFLIKQIYRFFLSCKSYESWIFIASQNISQSRSSQFGYLQFHTDAPKRNISILSIITLYDWCGCSRNRILLQNMYAMCEGWPILMRTFIAVCSWKHDINQNRISSIVKNWIK